MKFNRINEIISWLQPKAKWEYYCSLSSGQEQKQDVGEDIRGLISGNNLKGERHVVLEWLIFLQK